MQTLQQMMADAAAFRGELVPEKDPIVARIRAAASRLAWGMSEEATAQELVVEGATQAEAFLAVKAARTL